MLRGITKLWAPILDFYISISVSISKAIESYVAALFFIFFQMQTLWYLQIGVDGRNAYFLWKGGGCTFDQSFSDSSKRYRWQNHLFGLNSDGKHKYVCGPFCECNGMPLNWGRFRKENMQLRKVYLNPEIYICPGRHIFVYPNVSDIPQIKIITRPNYCQTKQS